MQYHSFPAAARLARFAGCAGNNDSACARKDPGRGTHERTAHGIVTKCLGAARACNIHGSRYQLRSFVYLLATHLHISIIAARVNAHGPHAYGTARLFFAHAGKSMGTGKHLSKWNQERLAKD